MSTWGILGCGTIANEMAATFQKMGHEIYGVANRTPEKAEKFADKYGVKHVFKTYEEMLADENIDIIYVATPHSMHYENMKQAVNAGKHILCEKAITVNAAQLEEVLELAEEKGVVVREAMTISHMPLYKKLKERIKEGAIGNTKMVQVNFGSNKGYDSTQRFFALEAAGGALLDIGVYATAFARTFLSEMPNTILTTVEYLETGADEQSGIIMKNTEPNPTGTRVNPADPRTGITLDTTGGTVYFKLTETLKGQEAENRLLQMNQSLEEIKQGEYEHTGTTLVLFVYDVQAVNGFAAYPLNGLDIINSYTLYDGTCSKNIKNIESFYLSEGYEAMIPTNLNLYTGASSKMYEALWIPNEMTSFSNQIYTKNLTPYWVRYQF